MYLVDDSIVEVLKIASRVIRIPGVYGSDGTFSGPASVDAIYGYVKSTSSKPVEMKDVSFTGEFVCARLERYKDRDEICVKADQERPWKRFGAIKELAHILIDKDVDMSPYGDERIDDLVNSGLIGLASQNSPTEPPSQSEYLAEIAAIEIMYPLTRRNDDMSAAQEIGTHLNIRQISLVREMPSRYTATALNDNYRHYISKALEQVRERNRE